MKERKSGFLSTLKPCLAIFRIKAAEGFQYRTAGLANATTGIFYGFIEIIVYIVFYTYADNKQAGILAGLSLQQVVTYVWLAQTLLPIQAVGIDSEILSKINNGDIGIEMCRPLDLYFHWFAKTAASRLMPFFWRGSAIIIFVMLMPTPYRLLPPATPEGFGCMLLSTVSAFLLCTSYTMLVCSFRMSVSWGDGPSYMMLLVCQVFSGVYLPLQLWPKSLQGFLLIQPFAGYLDIPVRFYLGTLAPSGIMWAIGLQLGWAAVFLAAGKIIMSIRLKNIIVQGG